MKNIQIYFDEKGNVVSENDAYEINITPVRNDGSFGTEYTFKMQKNEA